MDNTTTPANPESPGTAKPKAVNKLKTKVKGQVDQSKALKLKLDNKLTYQEIADMQGVSKQAIHHSIAKLIPKEENEQFKNHRADILSSLQFKLLSSLTDEDIKKSPLGSRVLASCQLYDKERLERGKSTDNIMQLHVDIAAIKAMDEKINMNQSEQSSV